MAWDWLASLILSLHFLRPLMLTLSLLKMLIYFTQVEKHSFPPKFSCSYWSPKRMALPIFLFLLSLSQKTCFSYNRVGGLLRDPPRTISISNPPHQQWVSIQGQNSGSSVYVIHKVSSLLPSSASSINWRQQCLTLVGELETSSPQICLLPKAILVSFPGKCSEIGLL